MTFLACRRPQGSVNGERGQAILELLPVIALMAVLAFGVVDLGRAIWQLEVIKGLTREGSNLASRNTTLPNSVATVLSDGSYLKLSTNGVVIITSVKNTGTAAAPIFVMTGQSKSAPGKLSATSKIGTFNPNNQNFQQFAILPAETLALPGYPIPEPGATVYVTEIFDKYSPITPIGAFVKLTLPTQIYDVAYF